MSDERYSPVAVAALLAAVIMWASSFPLLKLALVHLPPITLAAIRYSIAAVFMISVLVVKFGAREALAGFRSDWKVLTVLGVVGIALPNAALNVGLQYTTASISAIIQASGPVFTVIFAIILLKEHLGGAKVAGTVLALMGTVLLIGWDGMDIADSTFVGNLFVLASALSYSVSGVVGKRALARHHPMAITGWSLVIGSIALFLATPLEFGRAMSFPPDLVAIVLLLAIFPGCLAFLLYYYILQTKDLSSISFFIYLIPVFSTAISIALLGEIVTAETVLFASLVIAGVAIAQYAPARKRKVKDEGRGARST